MFTLISEFQGNQRDLEKLWWLGLTLVQSAEQTVVCDFLWDQRTGVCVTSRRVDDQSVSPPCGHSGLWLMQYESEIGSCQAPLLADHLGLVRNFCRNPITSPEGRETRHGEKDPDWEVPFDVS